LQNGNHVSGQITTDGKTGALLPSDIVNWNFTITNALGNVVGQASSTDSNAATTTTGLTATSHQLVFTATNVTPSLGTAFGDPFQFNGGSTLSPGLFYLSSTPASNTLPSFRSRCTTPPQMRVVHRPRQRLDQRGRFPRRRPLLFQLLGERAPVAELQGEERLAPHLADLVQRHDVRVLPPRHPSGLAIELDAPAVGGE
jgi:hypothetical protein